MGIEINLHNTLSGKKEPFIPIKKGFVGMYHCGPTVYGYAHIGNMRSYIFADILRKMFEANNYTVQQIINITDVGHLTSDNDSGDDKIEKSAKEKGQTVSDIVEYYTKAFKDDLRALNIKTTDTLFPKASDHIAEQITLIQKLEEGGFVYTTSDGVYFDTAKYPEYGKLGNIDLEHLKEGARIGVNNEKRNITDFALWKFSPTGEKRLQEWPSPWGIGFPGWHIECSAMSMKYLGETFDIHTGGIDHIPVHHNNEIAQSEAATGKQYVNYWMHNAFIRINGEKISKSLGNVILVNDLKEKGFSPLDLRFWFLMARYNTQMDFSWNALYGAVAGRISINHAYNSLPDGGVVDQTYKKEFLAALSDELDTPKAIALTFQLLKDKMVPDPNKKATLVFFDSILSILEEKKAAVFSDEIKKLIADRKTARENKDWKESDRIRDVLLAQGVHSEDKAGGSTYF